MTYRRNIIDVFDVRGIPGHGLQHRIQKKGRKFPPLHMWCPSEGASSLELNNMNIIGSEK